MFGPNLSIRVNINAGIFRFQPTADVLGCNVYSDGSAAAIDTWNPSGTKTNELDNGQVHVTYSVHVTNNYYI